MFPQRHVAGEKVGMLLGKASNVVLRPISAIFWALMTLLNPVLSVENLVYIGYAGDPSSAVRVTRKRRVDRKKQHSDQNVFQCFVFGPKEAGKSSLLDSFVGRPFYEDYTPTTEERYTVNMVDQPGGTKKTLILREIPEDAIENWDKAVEYERTLRNLSIWYVY
ncbi:mitochondrial Rho GTPase 1-like protein [Tanacetum coccineum]